MLNLFATDDNPVPLEDAYTYDGPRCPGCGFPYDPDQDGGRTLCFTCRAEDASVREYEPGEE